MFPVEPEFVIQAEALQLARLAAAGVFVFRDGDVLGTRLDVRLRAENEAAARAAMQRARAEIARLDRVFNWRDAGSELGRLNASKRHVASDDLFTVVAAAERWRAASSGAYSARLGRLLEAWRGAVAMPDRAQTADWAREIASAPVELDQATRMIVRPDVVRFDLDGIAKGFIVDRALEAAMASEGVFGAMIDIGGDVRVAGAAPDEAGWSIGLPDPLLPYENAPMLGRMMLQDRAVATSGCGPRDRRIGGQSVSATLDPRTGWPVAHRRAATAMAATAMEADALATAMLVLSEDDARDCIEAVPGAAARVAEPGRAVWLLGRVQAEPIRWEPFAPQPVAKQQAGEKWTDGWIANITFAAPPKNMRLERAFRSPYVAIWVSDENNKLVRTLILIGSIKEWQEDNYIWWGLNRGQTQKMLDGRSMSTRGSGTYKVYWDGVDDNGAQMPAGKYVIHVETSRERGKHTHRMLPLDLSKPRQFESELPVDADGGSLLVEFRKFG